MHWLNRVLTSSIGCKVLMAVSGLAMVGFLLGHISGNLLVYGGPAAINGYAKTLRDFPVLLWIARLGLVGFIFIHIFSAIRLTRLNRSAKPIQYKNPKPQISSFASRNMGLSGLVIFAFILYHLAHLTMRWTHPEFAQLGDFDVYKMLLISFRSPLLTFTYCTCIILVMMHLSHGISSLFQTLGFYNSRYRPLLQKLGPGVSSILALAYLSIPISVYLGILK